MKRLFFSLWLSLVAHILFAQREQIGIRIEEFGASQILNPSEKLVEGNPILKARQLHLNVNLRTIIGEEGETAIFNGVQYRYLDVTFDDVVFRYRGNLTVLYPYPRKQEFHFLFYDLLALHSLSDSYTLVAALRPGIFSDFKNISSEHFRLEGALFVDRRMSESFTLGLGAARSSNFGRVLLLPIVHLLYISGTSFMLDALLPSRAELWFYPTKPVEAGVSLTLSGSQYAIGESDGLLSNQFGFANAAATASLRYNLFSTLYLSSELGYTVMRRAELVNYKLEGDARFIQQFNPENTWFWRVGLQVMY